MSRVRPTARERTPSLFDGLTDHERPPARGRDGLVVTEAAAPSFRPPPRIVWRHPTPSVWLTRDLTTARIDYEATTGEFAVLCHAKIVGRYKTILDAVDAAEKALRA